MQLGENMLTCAQNVRSEVHLDPRKIADILDFEAVGLGENQVTDGLFIFDLRLSAGQVFITAIRKGGRHSRGEAEEADGLAIPVMRACRPLAEVYNPAILQTDLHRLIAWFDIAVQEEEIFPGRLDQALDHAGIIENVTIQKKQRVPRAQSSGLSLERHQAALKVAGVVHEADAIAVAVPAYLCLYHVMLVANGDAHLVDASRIQSIQMPRQKRTAAELEQHLRRVAFASETPPDTSGEDDCGCRLLVLGHLRSRLN